MFTKLFFFPSLLDLLSCSLILCFTIETGYVWFMSLSIIYGTMQGSWIVRQSVGSTPCLLGKAVDCNYIRGPKYLEVI